MSLIQDFLVFIFRYSDWISVFSPNTGKYWREKTPNISTNTPRCFHVVSMWNTRGAFVEYGHFSRVPIHFNVSQYSVSSLRIAWKFHGKLLNMPLNKKWSFLSKISSANVTKSGGNLRKFSFFVQCEWFPTKYLKSFTMWNTKSSPNFPVWKFCRKAQFPAIWLKLCGNYALSQNFHTR